MLRPLNRPRNRASEVVERLTAEITSGRLPPGATGYTVISTLSGSGVCTRTIQYHSTGHGQPQVLTRTSGQCAASGPRQAWKTGAPDNAPGLTSVSYRPAP